MTIVSEYLDLLDSQREAAFSALEGFSAAQIWQRPGEREWCIGEILNHNTMVFKTIMSFVRFGWRMQHRRAERYRFLPFQTDTVDPYRKPFFPMWVGFLWTPHYTPKHPVSVEKLRQESRDLHATVRHFYEDKDPAMLGQVALYDPLVGSFNLVVILRISAYHNQLHYDDVFKLAGKWKE